MADARPVLRAPLRDLLDDELSEAQVQRIWRTLQNSPVRDPRRLRLQSQLWAAVAVLVVSLGAGSLLYLTSRPGPLAIQGGNALEAQRVLGMDRDASYRLTDGSTIRLAAAARVEVLANDGRAFNLRLESGTARFEVRAGGPRRWRVDSGELSVEVVGTSFTLDHAAHGVGVRVEHGVVVARGAGVPGGEKRLRAGERLFVGVGQSAQDSKTAQAPGSGLEGHRTEGAEASERL